MVRYTSVLHPASPNLLPPRKEVLVVNSTFLFYYGYNGLIERFHSRGQHLCKFIGTKESVCIRKEFNSQRTGLGHQHGRRFIVLGHQDGRRDVMWKHSILRYENLCLWLMEGVQAALNWTVCTYSLDSSESYCFQPCSGRLVFAKSWEELYPSVPCGKWPGRGYRQGGGTREDAFVWTKAHFLGLVHSRS